MECTLRKQNHILPILKFHFEQLLKSVLRNISRKPTLRRPGFLEVSVFIGISAYIEWFYAIRDFNIKTFRYLNITRNNDKSIKVISITFHHLEPLSFHVVKIVDLKIRELQQKYFKKVWTNGNTGELVTNERNPIVLKYMMKTGKLSVTGHFVSKNMCGNVCIYILFLNSVKMPQKR